MAKFCGWVPEPLDTPLHPPLQVNTVAQGNPHFRRDGADYDTSYIFHSVLQSIDHTLRYPELTHGVSPGAFGGSTQMTMNRDERYFQSNLPSTIYWDKAGAYRSLEQSSHLHNGHNQHIGRGQNLAKSYDPVGSLLENLESALKASESMLCRTQDLDIQAHAAIMQVKHLQDLLAKKETQYAQEINELHLLLRAERSERYTPP